MKKHYLIISCLFLVLAGSYLFGMLKVAGAPGFPLDDSWIHLQFAKNLITGNGFSYNADIPVNGSTSPLWTLLLAGAWGIIPSYFAAAVVLGVLFSVLTCIYSYKIAQTITKENNYPLLAGMLVAVTPPLAWAALSGMEPPLYAFLALAGIYFHITFRGKSDWRQYAATSTFALTAVARPECLILFPIAVIDNFITRRLVDDGNKRELIKKSLLHAAVFLIILIPYAVFNYTLSGSPVPTSFSAKVGNRGIVDLIAHGNIRNLTIIVYYVFQNYHDLIKSCVENNFILSLFFIIGFIALLFAPFREGSSHRSFILPLVLILQPLAMAVVTPFEGILIQNQRYITHFMPLLVIIELYGLFTLPDVIRGLFKLSSQKRGPVSIPGSMSIAVLLLIFIVSFKVQFFARFSDAKPKSLQYAYNVKNINEMQVRIGKWINENTDKNAVIAANDIGAIAFFGNRRIIDTVGLVTPEIIPYLRKGPDRQKGLLEYLELKRPDYLVIFPNWYPMIAARSDLFEKVYSVRLKDNITAGGREMVVYRTIRAGSFQNKP